MEAKKVRDLSVQVKLVADIQRKGEGAKVVQSPVREDVKPRVDIRTEVETGGFEGKNSARTSAGELGKVSTAPVTQSVATSQGKGLLGHRLSTTLLPDPTKLTTAELKALLEPHFGRSVSVTTYDREEAATLAEAVRTHNLGDAHGILRGVTDEGLVLEKDGRVHTTNSEYWAIARIKVTGDDAKVVAQDPSYPRLFQD
jgi:hypothetical protein